MEVLTPYAKLVQLIKANPNAWSWVELIEVGFMSVLTGNAKRPSITEWEIDSLDSKINTFGVTPIPPRIYKIMVEMRTSE